MADEEKQFLSREKINEILRESFGLPSGELKDTQDLVIKYIELVKYTEFLSSTVKLAVEQHFLELRKIEDITMNLN